MRDCACWSIGQDAGRDALRPKTLPISIARTSSSSTSCYRSWFQYVEASLFMLVSVDGCSLPNTVSFKPMLVEISTPPPRTCPDCFTPLPDFSCSSASQDTHRPVFLTQRQRFSIYPLRLFVFALAPKHQCQILRMISAMSARHNRAN